MSWPPLLLQPVVFDSGRQGTRFLGSPPAAFLPNSQRFPVPESPDLIVAGDFDADGHSDILTAHRGSNALYFLKGNGNGGFASAKRVEVAGTVTDLISGEINRPDGLPDLIVGVSGDGGSAALVYQSPQGALKAQPESFPVNQPIPRWLLENFPVRRCGTWPSAREVSCPGARQGPKAFIQ